MSFPAGGKAIAIFLFLLVLVSIAFISYILWCCPPPNDNNDIITFAPATNEKAVLINGLKGGVYQNAWNPGLIPAGQDSVKIGEFVPTSPPNPSRVLAFSQGLAPFLANQAWSPSSDTVNVHFPSPYDIKVKIWLLTTAAFQIKDTIQNEHCHTARQIWSTEGRGLLIACEIEDARSKQLTLTAPVTRSANADALFSDLDFSCDEHAGDIQNSSVYKAGVLNIYYVDKVYTDFGSGSNYGVHCNGTDPPNLIAIGARSHKTILAHEIGHALMGDDHVDDFSPIDKCSTMPATSCPPPVPPTSNGTPSLFDRTNVMHGVSSLRATLTEGQIFRAFFNNNSVLNLTSLYKLNQGVPPCGGPAIASTNECPPYGKRLWPDNGGEYGPWPSN